MPDDTRDPMEIAEERIAEAKRTGATKLDFRELRLQSVPESLWDLHHLSSLSLHSNLLTELPESLGNLTNLKVLDLRSNRLAALPPCLGRFTKLVTLLVRHNELTVVPDVLGDLVNLTTLSLHSNRLTAVPESLGNLTNLTTLELHFNRLSSLPAALGRLANLTTLSVHNNWLSLVPESFGHLTKLIELDIHMNNLSSVPESLGWLTNLTRLILYSNKLTSLPDSLGNLVHLECLELSSNRLVAVPECLSRLINLNTLTLAKNRLITLPDWIGNLINIHTLDLTSNQLTAVPESIGNMVKLSRLCPDSNSLTSLPESLGQLTKLPYLNLSNNQLASLPGSIGNLTKLTGLNLANNRLTVLPESLGRLTNLTTLSLQNNQLTAVPESLGRLTNLKSLFLHRNPALSIPAAILGPVNANSDPDWMHPAPPKEILDYYFRVVCASRPLNEGKAILVGRGEVGKTSLVRRLVHGEFTLGEAITQGISITKWRGKAKDGDEITLNVWDFGGQEIMHGTHQFFLTERSLYLLVLNGRAGDAKQEAEYWMQMIRSYGGDSPVLVVLNKQGQHPFDMDRDELQKRFPQIKGFVRTDCADNTGIAELRQVVAREAARLPNLRAKFPKSWFAIKDRLSGMAENFIGFEKFGTICDELGEKDPGGQESLAAVLHVLGIALNYRDDPRLNDTHVLNPQWVTGGIYSVVTAPLVATQHGILLPGDLAKILDTKTYPRHMHRFLTDLMRKFDVCFAVPDDSGKLLVPNLLGVAEPKDVPVFDPTNSLNFEYRYVVLPEGILPRFIARTHWYSEGKPRWRHGVALAFDGCEAVVRSDTVCRRITVRVSGPAERRRSLLTIIRSEFDRLHREFKANPPEAWVPLPGFPDVAVKFTELLALEAEGESFHTERINGQRQKFAVEELLSGLGAARSHDGRKPKRVFVSYSHKDETHKATLGGYLLQLVQERLIDVWDDRHLRPADDWAGDIDRNLNTADVILLLASKHFLASKYCMEIEMPRAIERRDTESVKVVPIILDDSKLGGQPFMTRQALPTDAKPILDAKHWPDPNDAWRQVSDKLVSLVAR